MGADSRGGLLLEVLIGLMVSTMVGTAVLSGFSATYRSGQASETQSVAENLARNQMEYAYSLPYQDPPATYTAVSAPTGYGVTAAAAVYTVGNPNIEKVAVTVTRSGNTVLVVESLRVK